jgi:ankyrin repeat protein
MVKLTSFLAILFLTTTIGCSEKSEKPSENQSEQELIKALVYHHEFKVAAIIDQLTETHQIDKKMETERVAKNANFWTPLCYASFIGNAKAVKLLLEKGADIHYKDSNGQTPFILAAITGNIEEMELLLQVGANINETDIDNRTALIHASSQGNLLTVKYLVEKGCELESKNGGQNALDFARFHGNQEIVDYLTKAFNSRKSL